MSSVNSVSWPMPSFNIIDFYKNTNKIDANKQEKNGKVFISNSLTTILKCGNISSTVDRS